MRRQVRDVVNRRTDIGFGRILCAWLLEPRSPFDPDARCRPNPGVVIVVGYVGLMAAAMAYFNWT